MTIDENHRLIWPYSKSFNTYDDEDEEDIEDDDTDNPCAYQRIKETVECYQKSCENPSVYDNGKCTSPLKSINHLCLF